VTAFHTLSRPLGLALAIAVALAFPAPGVRAAALQLSEAERAAAIRLGAASVQSEAFDTEWRVNNGNGEALTVLTPFYLVANAARQATFKNDPIKPTEIDKLLRSYDKRLVVQVSLRGPREDFARLYAPRLLIGDREVKATFVQNERTAARQADGGYLALCTYGFPTRDLSGNARLALVIDDGAGRDVSRFTIELSAMR